MKWNTFILSLVLMVSVASLSIGSYADVLSASINPVRVQDTIGHDLEFVKGDYIEKYFSVSSYRINETSWNISFGLDEDFRQLLEWCNINLTNTSYGGVRCDLSELNRSWIKMSKLNLIDLRNDLIGIRNMSVVGDNYSWADAKYIDYLADHIDLTVTLTEPNKPLKIGSHTMLIIVPVGNNKVNYGNMAETTTFPSAYSGLTGDLEVSNACYGGLNVSSDNKACIGVGNSATRDSYMIMNVTLPFPFNKTIDWVYITAQLRTTAGSDRCDLAAWNYSSSSWKSLTQTAGSCPLAGWTNLTYNMTPQYITHFISNNQMRIMVDGQGGNSDNINVSYLEVNASYDPPGLIIIGNTTHYVNTSFFAINYTIINASKIDTVYFMFNNERIMLDSPDLVSNYMFNDGGAGSTADTSRYNRTANIGGSLKWGANGGWQSGGYLFNGSSNSTGIIVSRTNFYSPLSNYSLFTISLCLKPNNYSHTDVAMVVSFLRYNALRWQKSNAMCDILVNNGSDQRIFVSCPYNTWTCIDMTKNVGNFSVYRNGIMTNSLSLAPRNNFANDNTRGVRIGGDIDYPDATGYLAFNGSIDDLRFWNYTMNSSEIAVFRNYNITYTISYGNTNAYAGNFSNLTMGRNFTGYVWANDSVGSYNASNFTFVMYNTPATINYTLGGAADNASLTATIGFVYVNVTSTEIYWDSVILNWNGTNQSLKSNGTYAGGSFFSINKSGLGAGNYTYFVWINNTVGYWNSTEKRVAVVTAGATPDITAPVIVSVNATPANWILQMANTKSVTFWVNATDDSTMGNCTLYHNASGSRLANLTKVGYINGTNTSIGPVNFTNDGLLNWSIYCNDNSSNHGWSKNYTLDIDTTNPTVSQFNMSSVNWDRRFSTSKSISFYFTASDLNPSTCRIWHNASGTFAANMSLAYTSGTNMSLGPINFSSDGSYNFSVVCNDTAAYTSWFAQNYTIAVDTTNPTITQFNASSVNWASRTSASRSIAFYVTASDLTPDSCVLWHNATGTFARNMTIAYTSGTNMTIGPVNFSSDGNYNFSVSCNDTAAKTSWFGNNFTIILDTLIPNLYYSSPTDADNFTVNLSRNYEFVNISFAEINNVSVIINFNGTNYSGSQITLGLGCFYKNFTNLSIGNYSYFGYITDLAGNVNSTVLRHIIVHSYTNLTVNFSLQLNLISPFMYGAVTRTSEWLGNETFLINNDGSTGIASDMAWHRDTYAGMGMKFVTFDIDMGSSDDGSSVDNSSKAKNLTEWASLNGYAMYIMVHGMPRWLADKEVAGCNPVEWWTCPGTVANETIRAAEVVKQLDFITQNGKYTSNIYVGIENELYDNGTWMQNFTNWDGRRFTPYIVRYNATINAIKAAYPMINVGGSANSYAAAFTDYGTGTSTDHNLGGMQWFLWFLQNVSTGTMRAPDFQNYHEYRDGGANEPNLYQTFTNDFQAFQGNCTSLSVNCSKWIFSEWNEGQAVILVNQSDRLREEQALAYLFALEYAGNATIMLAQYEISEPMNWTNDNNPAFPEHPQRFIMYSEPRLNGTAIYYPGYNITKEFATNHIAGGYTYWSNSSNESVKVIASKNTNKSAITIINMLSTETEIRLMMDNSSIPLTAYSNGQNYSSDSTGRYDLGRFGPKEVRTFWFNNTALGSPPTPPSFSANTTNATNNQPVRYGSLGLNVTFTDTTAIHSILLASNQSGTFSNITTLQYSGATALATFNVSITIGKGVIKFQFCANNSGALFNCSVPFTISVRNTPPLVNVSLNYSEAFKNTTNIQAEGFASDTDGDTLTRSFKWYNQSGLLSVTSSNLSNSYFINGSVIIAEFTVTDGVNTTAVNTSTLTISNSSPVGNASINTSLAYKNTTNLGLIINQSNPDGGSFTQSFKWYNASGLIAATTSNLSSSYFIGGSVIVAQVNLTNSMGKSSLFNTSSLTISNSVPLVNGSINESAANKSKTNIQCLYNASDPDADSLTTTFKWFNQSGVIPITTSNLSNAYYYGANAIICELTSTDGTATVRFNTSSLVIGNSVPTANGSINESVAWKNTTNVQVLYNASDPDFNTMTSSFRWFNQSGLIAVTASNLSSSKFWKGSVLVAEVTVNDGSGSYTFNTSSLTITNSVPLVNGSINESLAYKNTTNVQCLYNASDPDLDSLTTSFRWFNQSGLIAITASNLSYTTYIGGSVLVCELSTTDGTATVRYNTSSLTITNSVPNATGSINVSYVNKTFGKIQILTNSTDADGQQTTLTFKWFNTTGVIAETTSNLSNTSFIRGSVIKGEVTISDGSASFKFNTSSLTVNNSGPTFTSGSINESVAYKNTTNLHCAVNTSDLDNDTLTTTFRWFNQSGLIGVTSSTLANTRYVGGSNLTCEATTTDTIDTLRFNTTSLNITISTPVANASIDASLAYKNTTSLGIVVNQSDSDGSALSQSFRWYNQTGLIAVITSNLSNSYFIGGSVITAEINVTKAGRNVLINTSSLTISNTPPNCTVVFNETQINKSLANIQAIGLGFDADGQAALTYQFKLYNETNQVTAALVSNISMSFFHKGNNITVSLTVSDGSATGVCNYSANVQNSNPNVTTQNTFENATAGHSFLYYANVTDADGAVDIVNVSCVLAGLGTCLQVSNSSDGLVFGVLWNVSHSGMATVTLQTAFNDTNSSTDTTVASSNTYPNQAPAISVKSPPANTNDWLNLSANFTYSDADSDTGICYLMINITDSYTRNVTASSIVSGTSLNLTANGMMPGSYNWKINCSDSYTNTLSSTRVYNISPVWIPTSHSVLIEYVTPTLPNASHISIFDNSSFINATINSTASLNTIILLWNGTNHTLLTNGTWTMGSFYSINMTELEIGNYSYYLWAEDINGLSNISQSRSLYVDKVGIRISILPITPDDNTFNNVTDYFINASVYSPYIHTVILDWNGTNNTLTSNATFGWFNYYYINITSIPYANYTWYVWANDTQEQTNISVSWHYNLSQGALPKFCNETWTCTGWVENTTHYNEYRFCTASFGCSGAISPQTTRPIPEGLFIPALILAPLIFGLMLMGGSISINKEHKVFKIFIYILSMLTFIVSMNLGLISIEKFYPELTTLKDQMATVATWFTYIIILMVVYWCLNLLIEGLKLTGNQKQEYGEQDEIKG